MLPLEQQSESLQAVVNGTNLEIKCNVILKYKYYYIRELLINTSLMETVLTNNEKIRNFIFSKFNVFK